MFHFRCPNCDATLRTGDDKHSMAVTCPRCRERVRVPDAPGIERAEAEPPPEEMDPPARRRRRKKKVRRYQGDGTFAWPGGHVLGWVIGALGVFLLNAFLCCGWFGWHYAKNLQLDGIEDTPEIVQATQVLADYQNDPAGADGKYKNRELNVTGIVEESRREGVQKWRLVLRGDNAADTLRIDCTFEDVDEEAAELAQLKKGQQVKVVGTCLGKKGHVRLNECALLE